MSKEKIKSKMKIVIITGLSGAGKTEAAKRIMAFLMELSQRRRAENNKKNNCHTNGDDI